MGTHLSDRWRWLPILAAAGVWLAFLAITLVPEWQAAARARFRWMLEPLFHDWHVVRLGWESNAAGIDPLAAKNDPFNYPRFVLLGATPGRHVPTNVAALAGAALFLGALVQAMRPRSRAEALLATALVVSPPVLLMIERGNLDAWVFVLVVAGAGGLTAASSRMTAFAAGTIALVVATMLKLYPAVLLPAAALFWRGHRRAWGVAGFAVFVGWLVTHVEEVILVMQKTTRGLEPAYGRMIAGSRYYVEAIEPRAPANGAEILGALMTASLGVCAAGFLIAAFLGWRWRSRIAEVGAGPCERVIFWSGALIYGGTFMLGSNWSYRLVFLALCVPLLWRATQTPALRAWGAGCLAGIAVMFLSPFHLPLGLFLGQQAIAWLLAFAVFGGAVGLLTRGLNACAPEGAE